MSNLPLISVVIPTYNRVQQVQSALNSVLMQTYREFEVIIVDDGSTDGTCHAIHRIIRKQSNDRNRIRYFFQPNQGQSVARNKGIYESRGQWIAFLDSDDVWMPEKLEWQVRAIERYQGNCYACFTDVELIDNHGMNTTAFHESSKRYRETLNLGHDATKTLVKTRDPYWITTLLVNSDVARKVGWFDNHLRYAEDHDFIFRLSLFTSFICVNKQLSIIDRSRSPEGSKCRPWDMVDVRLRGSLRMYEKWMEMDSKLSPDIQEIVLCSIRRIHSAWGNWYLEHKRYEEARKSVRMAIKCKLTVNLAIKYMLMYIAPWFARMISHKMRVY
jgi:glycosyltransferase involved in cell wall biosynthesis